jgi:hypothetical protein
MAILHSVEPILEQAIKILTQVIDVRTPLRAPAPVVVEEPEPEPVVQPVARKP